MPSWLLLGTTRRSRSRLLLLDETSGLLVWARAGTERAPPQRPPVRGLGTRQRLGPRLIGLAGRIYRCWCSTKPAERTRR